MDEQQLLALKPELDRFLDRYAPLFGRDENQPHARRFVQGLLRGGERRNTENIAEGLKGGPVRSLQAFITTGAWLDKQIVTELRSDVLKVLADEDGVWNSDETGFPKKGTKSVGVKRQYSGTLGRTDNCQIGVFANYCSVKGHTLVDRRLFLPEEWATDPERREEAGVPPEVVFRTKPALALEMLADAVAARVPFRWVGGDSIYGENPTFVQGVRALGKCYVVDVNCDTQVWAEQPQVIQAPQRPQGKRGRQPKKPLVVGKRVRIDTLVAALPASVWRRVVVGEGSQGPRMYEYAELTVWFCEDELPTATAERLLVRRSLGQSAELKYHRSNASSEIPLQKLAEVRGTRWTIEEDIQSAKGECGLDEYETRGWVGWHHHTALSMLAQAFMTLQKHRLGEKRVPERVSDNSLRGSRSVDSSAGRAGVGQQRDSRMVPVATRTQSPSRSQSPKAAGCRVAAAAKSK